MNNSDFYGYQQEYYEKPPKEKRHGAGGYIITAIISFIVGVLITSVLLTRYEGNFGGMDIIDGMQPHATPTPNVTQVIPEDDGGVPALTPRPTERPMPQLDGIAPDVFDSVNPIPDIVDQVTPGVVGIINYTYSKQHKRNVEISSGSGFIISTEGYIVTNAHVIQDAVAITVLLSDGTEAEAELIGFDKTMDLAVIKIDKPGLAVLKLGNSSTVRVGEFALAIGDPTGRELAGTTTFGIVSAKARNINIDGIANDYLQTDAAVNPGNSGGPLLNMAGEVIGVTSAKTVTASYDESGNAIAAEGLGFALPINEAMEVITKLITSGNIQRPGIGISVITVDETSAIEYSIPQGVLVYSVTKDGPGHKAGLAANDIIIECNGKKVTEQDQFVQIIKGCNVGDLLKLRVWRAGEYIETDLTLSDLNGMGNELVDNAVADFKFFE
ncbi:MAG: trypsin-like peptidase domain-containing protein [Clostridia bacterium]